MATEAGVSARPDVLADAHLRPCVAVIPAFNEAAAIGQVVRQALAQQIAGYPVFDAVVVADNASQDATADCAREAGARVVHQPERGYGAACLAGIAAALAASQSAPSATRVSLPARCIVFIDGDASVDLRDTARLLAPLIAGADLAIGARHNPPPLAMGLPQRFGNWLASALIRLLWGVAVTDLGPFRAVRVDALQRIGMRDRRFGWTTEMQVRAIQLGLRMQEVPVALLPRVGHSKISGTWRGVLGAAHGIFSTIGALWWAGRQRKQVGKLPKTLLKK